MILDELYKTEFYKLINEWLDEWDSLDKENIIDEDKFYEYQRIKLLRKNDFLRTFIIICEMSYEYINNQAIIKDQIRDIIGSVFGRIIFETSDILLLHKVIYNYSESNDKESRELFWKWIEDRRNGYIWIKDTNIDYIIDATLDNSLKNEIIKEIPIDIGQIDNVSAKNNSSPKTIRNFKGLTYYEYSKYEFAVISGSSYSDIESMMARGISRTSLCNILYGFILIKLFINALEDNFYITWHEDRDSFKGKSGCSYFFNGLIFLDIDGNNIQDPWLLKCITSTHDPLEAVASVSSSLEDIGIDRCILFLPTYPSERAMRYFVYTYSEKDQEIIILYLNDLYELLKSPIDEILNYLRNRRISS